LSYFHLFSLFDAFNCKELEDIWWLFSKAREIRKILDWSKTKIKGKKQYNLTMKNEINNNLKEKVVVI